VLTATPIPRTLVLTFFGDMDISELREKPAGRLPIDTRIVPLGRVQEVVAAVGRAIEGGERVYWVCPLVEESEAVDLAAAEQRFAFLKERFGAFVGLVHGRLKGAEKDAAMARFAAGETRLLVATTVIEVGVDVPEATVMVIEHAERFGLAQLHQLRGRTGRGHGRSTCLLLYKAPLGPTAKARLEIMRDMGVNAIRTSHNPPAPELLDLTDRMGFIVLDEAFDMWKKEKTKYDYHLDWDAWHERDLSDMVRRDRNHPSVFMWSIGNEVMEQWTNDDSTAIPIARELAGIVRRLDPTRPITSASNNGSPANPVFHSGALDLLGHNYHHEAWPNFPTQFPGQKFIITEAMSALNSRGVYEQPSDSVASYATPYVKDSGPQPNKDYRLSSYDDRKAFWGSLHEESLRLFERYPFLSGIFIWTGIDYLGEPTPYAWPARSSYFGVVDLAGFPKDPYYLYQSMWTTRPMLHVFPHWNWTARDSIDVWAYTNGDEAELFLNGVSLGVKRKVDAVSHLMWRVSYAPGTLRAVARKGGQVMATQEVKTAGPPARVALAPDRSRLHADGNDLSFVTVTVLDRAGVAVPTADQVIRFRLRGDARIIGVDNGDQISHAPFQADRVRLFNGKALVIVRAGEQPGTVTLTAEGEGLEPAAVQITSRR